MQSVSDYVEAKIQKEIGRRKAKTKIERKSVDKNNEVITTVSGTIRTIEGLLDAAKLPRDTLKQNGDTLWVVDDWTANKWDQGVVINHVHRVVELWQVNAKLRRRVLAPVLFEPVAPVELKIVWRNKKPCKSAPSSALKRAIIIPDSQHGFARDYRTGALDPLHDPRAVQVAIEMIRIAKPDRVILLGDHLDLPDWSEKFLHGAEFAFTTQAAVNALSRDLVAMRGAAGDSCKIDYLKGNHETRLEKAQQRNLIAASALRPATDMDGPPILSIERLLDLQALNIECHPYPSGRVWPNDNVFLHHGHVARNESGGTAAAVLRDARCSEGFGHLHRRELVCKTTHPRRGPVTYMAFCPGTISRIDGAVPAATPRVNWQQGAAELFYEEGNGPFDVHLIAIHNGVAIYNGKRIDCSDVWQPPVAV